MTLREGALQALVVLDYKLIIERRTPADVKLGRGAYYYVTLREGEDGEGGGSANQSPPTSRQWGSYIGVLCTVHMPRCAYMHTYMLLKVSCEFNERVPTANKLITRPIMAITSPNSPHITFTHTKFRFHHFWDIYMPVGELHRCAHLPS